MKTRITMWACAGFLVAGSWGFYFGFADKSGPIEPAVYALARFTQPVAAIALSYLHRLPVNLGWLLLVNAATYALIGLAVETIRARSHQAV